MNNLKYLTALTLVFGVAACGDDSESSATTRTLRYQFSQLPELGSSAVYEGWLIVPDAPEPVSTGRFTVDGNGQTQPSSFELDAGSADAATTFVLTIEPAQGDVPAPADTHILAGDLTSGAATLTTMHAAALGTDFGSAAGELILATPTTAMDDDETLGIWFLSPTMPPAAALSLPPLPAGWVYEGWVVGEGPVSTGTFTDPAAPDSDGAGSGAGPMNAPPFPGQDFINPARDLASGHSAVISVEPSPDDSPAPFLIKPLSTMLTGETAPTTQTLTNISAGTLPGGTLTISEE